MTTPQTESANLAPCKEIAARIGASYIDFGYPTALVDFAELYRRMEFSSLTPANVGFTSFEFMLERAYTLHGQHLGGLKLRRQAQVEAAARIKALDTTAYIAEFPAVALDFLQSEIAIITATAEMVEFKKHWNAIFNNVLK